MNITKYIVVFATVLLAAGCDGTGISTKGDAVEYRVEDFAYADGDSCTERYLLYADDGSYERYIGGTYYGESLGSTYRGTLFETGQYEENSQYITFSPKKQYNLDTKKLENLGLERQLPYYGTISSTTLTITWRVSGGYVPVIYKRK